MKLMILLKNTVSILRFCFLFGLALAAVLGIFLDSNLLFLGYLQGIICVAALAGSKIFIVIFQGAINKHVPGSWSDLTPSDFEELPAAVKTVAIFQYLSLFYLVFVFGWFSFSMIYFWFK